MSLRRREFPEVLENLLTAISRGVAAESHPFPPPGANGSSYRHDLQQPPVADVVSVYGSRDGQPHLFRKDVDYTLLDDTPRQTIEWKEGAQLPDPGTLIQVNYYPESAQPVLTDLYTGSVVRTLSESIALEIARLYAQLEVVYRSGFVDTATGSSLDNVVALLGIERVAGGRPAGEVEFTRSPGSRGIINIPAGARIITADGNVEYETTESVTLAEGQNTIRVVARDLEINDPLPADALTVLPVPIAGIAGDQQAALFGQAAHLPGMAKNTYGTGNFTLLTTGSRPVTSRHGLLTTIAWQIGERVTYALEGSIFVTGAAVQWLRDGLGLIKSAAEVEALAVSVPDSGGVVVVPAFTGLGAPHWDAYARGAVFGLTRGTTGAHIARATLESIALQSRDVLLAMAADANLTLQELRVDGGATANNLLMQVQASLLDVPVVRPAVAEVTALGAAYLAGLATGYWSSLDAIANHWQAERTFYPALPAHQRATLVRAWDRAVHRCLRWAADE